jgi:hypothetical protein
MTDIQERLENELPKKLFVRTLNHNDGEELIKYIKSLITLSVEAKEKEIIKLKADMAHAIGYCRGLGHPETYLEKTYPSLSPKKEEE